MSTNQSWGGRFAEGPREAVAAYTDSQTYDRALYAQDIRGSQAHARMLGRQGVITPEEAEQIVNGLDAVKQEIESGAFVWKPALEDVHMNIEARLTEIIGDVGKKLHTGRSRNDQVGLTFRLFVADRLTAWQQRAAHLCATLVSCADGHQDDILPGCTHMQPAQPVSLAHHLLAYAWMFRRDCMRLDDVLRRVRISPLGAAALAGTTYPLDPQSVADEVGFDGIYGNSMDAVSDRDFVLEALFAASCIMAHLSRLCEELIIWANPAFGFVQLSDGYSTGSSIMPQKKNPDVAELMRGKTGRVYGALMGMLTIMKGLPMTYNRDLQEDKEGFLDADRTVDASLMLIAGMLEELTACAPPAPAASSMPRNWPTIWWARACPSARPIMSRAMPWPWPKNRARAWKTFRWPSSSSWMPASPMTSMPCWTTPPPYAAAKRPPVPAPVPSDRAAAYLAAGARMSQQKATGWKVPLLFCAVMGVAVLGTWLWRNLDKPEVPPLEPGLVAAAQTYHIDLDADPEGKLLRESITNASTGFAPHDSKDARLAALIDKSLDMDRFDAACVAAVLLFDPHKREGKLMHIARSAARDCATLPWGAFAAKAMKDPGVQTDAHFLLNARWRECPRP